MIRSLLLSISALALLLAAGCASTGAPEAHQGALRHVVLFKFKADATPQQIIEIEDAFRALPGKIPEILDFEWGSDVSVEGLTKDFTHCFLVTFEDPAARAIYLPHPVHQEFVALVGPVVEEVLVFDYIATE